MSLQSLNTEIAYIKYELTNNLEEELHTKFIHDYYFRKSEIKEALEDGLKIALGSRLNPNTGNFYPTIGTLKPVVQLQPTLQYKDLRLAF